MRNIFAELSQINVNDHVEKKKDLTYLSWSWAKSEICKRFPLTTFEVIRNPDPVSIPVNIPIYEGTEWITDNYGKKKEVPKIVDWNVVMIKDDRLWPSPIGATVRTTCTVNWDEMEGDQKVWYHITTSDELPVMNASNKAIPLGEIDAMNVNKTLQRSFTKCIAQQGLGLYIYAGEDLPEESEDVKVEKQKITAIKTEITAIMSNKWKSLDKDGQEAFKKRVKDIIGVDSVRDCDNLEKLEALLSSMR